MHTEKQAVSISGHSTRRTEMVISTRLKSCLSRGAAHNAGNTIEDTHRDAVRDEEKNVSDPWHSTS